MARYLLSAHTIEGEPRPQMSEDQMRKSFAEIIALEDEMQAKGAWVFSGLLHDPETATVVRVQNGKVLTTDGPFIESKEHLGGFYVIEAPDLDAALDWAAKVTAAVHTPIEVRPIQMWGALRDQQGMAAAGR